MLIAPPPEMRPIFTVDTWPQFEKLVQDYDFAGAQEQLEKALKTFPGT